jgi:hypothetical protein
MADIQAFNHPSTSDNIEKGNPKGTGTIHNSVIDSKETSHTNAVFEDVEAHIRYKDFKTKQVREWCRNYPGQNKENTQLLFTY